MLLSNRSIRLVIDAAVAQGVDRAALMLAMGPDGEDLLRPGRKIEWGTFAACLDELSRLVGGDRERLRAIGRGMQHTKSPDVLRDVARGVLTPRALYRFVDRWIVPDFPHLAFYMRFVSDRRVRIHADIPEPHAPALAYFYVYEGRLPSVTEMMGLPASTLLESRITPRSADMLLELPEDTTLGSRARRVVRALLARPASRAAQEAHRMSLAESVEALQRARDELRVLLDRLPDLALVHSGGKILWANRAFVQTLGYGGVEEIVGTPTLDAVAPRSRAAVAERMAQPPEASWARDNTIFYLLGKGGEEILVEAAPTQSVVFDGVPARMVVGRDVTERARLQEKLILADRLASIGLLAAGVAHEVNNPLAYVLNNIEIARKVTGALGKETEVAHHALAIALEGVDRIGVIVRDLLLLARGNDVANDAIELTGVVESTIGLAAREIERTARLVLDIGPAPLVDASESRIAQVLLNLIGNALEAMRGRKRDDNELRVKVGYADDGRFSLEVSDNGVGIAAAQLGHVFEPFFTTKPAGSGTGLGLSIAQRLVVELGGEITVASEIGRGTTFRVLLPASQSRSTSDRRGSATTLDPR